MTLCIAAIARKEPSIITVSDMMLSTSYMSADTQTLKVKAACRSGRYMVMFSGSPSVCLEVTFAAEKLIASGGETIAEVVRAYTTAFRDELKNKIEGELLSPYGLDRDTFVQRGRQWFGEEEFGRLQHEVSATELNTTFLVAGFDPDDRPHIFSVSDPGTHLYHGPLGFHAIGGGWIRALGALYGTYEDNLAETDLVYRLCEAKFHGESAPGVGKKTFILALSPGPRYRMMYTENVKPIRDVWTKKGRPPVPARAKEMIVQGFRPLTWTWGSEPRK